MAEKIVITTDELKKKQEKWMQLLKNTKNYLEELEGLFGKLEESFLGKPVTAIKAGSLKKLEEEGSVLAQLGTHLEKLTEIAAIYEQAEGSNRNVTVDY